MINQAKSILKDVFGYDSFRPMQEEIIKSVLNKKDVLAIMPTGSGKSLCFQIPAIIFEGLTIVVSPLISLMKDQVEQLKEIGVEAVVLNSSISYKEYNRNIAMIRQGVVKMLYVAPETLLKDNIIDFLGTVKVECITIDEVHCISEWGHDFRPEYRMLKEVRNKFTDAVYLGFTATATARVQEDIKNNLGFTEENSFISSFNRDNLFLQVLEKDDPLEQSISFLEKNKDQSGIIYCFSRDQVDNLTMQLDYKGYSVKPYHAGLPGKDRAKNQELFIKDDIQIIVATVAFGMGINKPNVRFIIHYDLPQSIETYYQQIGRAGRDGLTANCLLLFSYGDIRKIRYLISNKSEQEQIVANDQINSLLSLVTTENCRRKPLLLYFGENHLEENCNMCDMCVSEQKEKQDITIEAQKLLSCVIRTRQIYGLFHIVDVLRGSKSKKIIDAGHNNLSTYGIGKDLSKKDWCYIAQQLINSGFLIKEPKYGSLKLTNKSNDLLNSKIKFKGYFVKDKDDTLKTFKEDIKHDNELLQRLKQKRKQLADNAFVPPYIIFSDKTLIEMASYFPQSNESFLNINGVGNEKCNRYGSDFLAIIKDHANKNNIKESLKIIKKKVKKIKKYMIIGKEYNEGKSIDAIISEYKVQFSTVLEHLFKYVKDGFKIRGEELLKYSKVPQNEQQKIMEAFVKKGYEYLKPAYDELMGEIGYDELKILRVYYYNKYHNIL